MSSGIVVIGGGVTGCGVARDLAMRGMDVTLVERRTLNSGTSGHSHGVLHSGVRYADTDPAIARDCYAENLVLKRIASGCVRDTTGYFVSLETDDIDYVSRKRYSCASCGIPVTVQTGEQVRSSVPALSSAVTMGLEVPDAVVSATRLVAATAASARAHGAEILTQTPVRGINVEKERVTGVEVQTGEQRSEIRAGHVVNAAGPWARTIGSLASVSIDVALSSGAMAVIDYTGLESIVNRCRPPSDGDIVVPYRSRVVAGTTSQRIRYPTERPETRQVIDRVRSECAEMIPGIATAPVRHWYRGIRTLVPGSDEPDSRSLSRGFRLLDHAERDGVAGLTSIIGGKLTTHRLMAEVVADHVADQVGNSARCRTAVQALPGSDNPERLRDYVAEFSTETVATDNQFT